MWSDSRGGWKWRTSRTSEECVCGASCYSQYTLLRLALPVFDPKPLALHRSTHFCALLLMSRTSLAVLEMCFAAAFMPAPALLHTEPTPAVCVAVVAVLYGDEAGSCPFIASHPVPATRPSPSNGSYGRTDTRSHAGIFLA